MFTGIIQEKGKIIEIKKTGSMRKIKLRISSANDKERLKVGDSISVNGVCLTVIDTKFPDITVEVMPETIRRTTISHWKSQDEVNLERALNLESPLGGHIVQGHVDSRGRIKKILHKGGSILITIEIPADLTRYIINQGSIAIDGVSLTVIDSKKTNFTVGITPYTAKVTTLGKKRVGEEVNIEVDMVGKYLEKLRGSEAK